MKMEFVHRKHSDISVGVLLNWGWHKYSFFIMIDCYKHTFGIIFGEKPWTDCIKTELV